MNSYANGHPNGAANGAISASGTPEADTEDMEGTVEFRLMMAYAQRRSPGKAAGPQEEGQDGTNTQQGVADTGTVHPAPTSPDRPKKRKRGLRRRLRRLFVCIPPKDETALEDEGSPPDPEGVTGFRIGGGGGVDSGEALREVADRLTRIADTTTFTPGDLETDGEEDAVEKVVGLLLREHGDRFNEEVLKDASLARALLGYSFFERVLSIFLRRMGLTPDPSPQGSPRTEIALTCDVASRLSALDTLPMNRVMGFGAKYLKDHFSPWVLEKGGYEEVFESEDDDEEVH